MPKVREVDYECKDSGGTERGYFHKFIGGHMSAPEAIIETKQGKILQVPVKDIQFPINPKMKGF